MTMTPNHSTKILAMAVVLGLFIATREFCAMRELVAALTILSILFGTVGSALAILILIQEAVLKGTTHFKPPLAYVRVQHAAASVHLHGDSMVRSPRRNC